MKKTIKKISVLALVLVMVCSSAATAFAMDASVRYEGDSDQFVFLPGSGYSPTDLFTNFKGVMPGDTIYQSLEVKNTTSDDYTVKLYMKALGASDLKDADGNEIVSYEKSEELLKQMKLTVTEGSGGEYFNAAANETAGLTDWVYLGEVSYGGAVELRLGLEVPITMGNDFQQRIGALQWTFKAEEIPVGENPGGDDEQEGTTEPSGGDDDGDGDGDKDKDKDGKPDSAKTGDDMNLFMIGGIGIAALAVILVLVFGRRRREE